MSECSWPHFHHRRVANAPKFEPQWLGGPREGGHACPGKKSDTAHRPGTTGNWEVCNGPWVWAMPTSSVENPQEEAFRSARKRKRGCDATRRTKPRVMSDPGNGAPGARKKQQRHNSIPTTSQPRNQPAPNDHQGWLNTWWPNVSTML